jgi:outer membrane protein assembly factor BamB
LEANGNKEKKMNAITKTTSVAVLIALGLALGAMAANAAESPSVPNYGAADFRPTPDQPIGFQADGNGWYPGATPAVVEWWDGTPGWGKVAMREGTGNQQPSWDGRTKEVEARVLLDRTPKNILWKMPTPGMSDSQPLVIGDRIVNTYWPHFVVCYDRQTGKELWRDELEVAFLPELQNDRKTIGPAPDPVEARRRQTVLELGWAMRILSYGLRDFDGEAPGPAEYPRVRWAVDHLQRWRKVLEEADPKAVPILDEDIALLKRFLAGEHGILGWGSKQASEGRIDEELPRRIPQFGMAVGPNLPQLRGGKGTLSEYAQDTVRASLNNDWPGWMPFHCTTGVSDGEIVVVQFYHGQIAAYEVATGKRRWAWRDPVSGSKVRTTERLFSPRLKGDAVFAQMLWNRNKEGGLFCLDKNNGSARWFARYDGFSSYATIVTPVLIDVPVGAQDPVAKQGPSWPLLIDARAAILEQATGRKVGQIYARGPAGVEKGKPISDCFYPLVFGDRVIVGTGNDMGRHYSSVLRLRPDGQGNAEDLEEDRFSGKASRTPRVRNEHFVFGPDYAYDLRTRSTVGFSVGRDGTDKLAAIGDLCIGSGGFDDTKFRPRRDGAALLTWPVFDGAAKPYDTIRLISNRSLLGGADVPADLWVNKHLPGFDMLRLLAPRVFCGRYGNYVTAHFGHYLNGPVASGDRIFIQSQNFLYCIGPAVRGTPADDPAVVAEIRKASDAQKLVARLNDASAQYRYEAVRRIANLGLPISDLEKASSSSQSTITNRQSAVGILKSLATEDAYEEIRAEAILALNACDPQGRAGWDRLMADYMVNFWSDPPPKEGWAYNTNRDRTERWHWIQMTLRALGEQGRVLLERVYPEMAKNPVPLRIALDIATTQQWRIGPLVKDGLEVAQRGPLAKTAPWQSQVPVNTENAKVLPGYFAASDAATDPAAAEILLKAYPNTWELYPTFARNLPPERFLAWFEPIALASSHPSNRPRILSAWRAIGPAALPSMERVRAAMAGCDPAQDKLAASYAEDIAKQIAEMKDEGKTTPPATTPEAKKN